MTISTSISGRVSTSIAVSGVTMISDVLSDAVTAIERYRADPVFRYPEHWPEMDALVEAMDAVRRTLDAPPMGEPCFGSHLGKAMPVELGVSSDAIVDETNVQS